MWVIQCDGCPSKIEADKVPDRWSITVLDKPGNDGSTKFVRMRHWCPVCTQTRLREAREKHG